ncbi:MAG: molybdopterin molybdotransferase MoeA [Bacteroidia bacterium]
MISVDVATHIVQSHLLLLPEVSSGLLDSHGKVLRESLLADRDFPPFNRVMMDGIAIRYETFASGIRVFPVEETLAAGGEAVSLTNPGHCIEVMTGAVLPEGTDTVIRYEDLEFGREETPPVVKIVMDRVKHGQNVHWQGSDHLSGSVLIEKGVKIGAPEIGVAASIGKTNIQVSSQPRVAVVSTGDEIVQVNETPLRHQIRSSNGEVLVVSLREMGIFPDRFHIGDSEAAVNQMISELLKQYEVIILSGGVSKGKFDFIPDALEKQGVVKHFHQVAQRPGKPFWFGVKGENERIVFALPGNPVSTFVNFVRYVKPWLERSLGLPAAMPMYATLAEPIFFGPELTFFLQVKIEAGEDGHLFAVPVKANGSGDHGSLLYGNGFLELPPERSEFLPGENYPLWLYRSLTGMASGEMM